MKKTTTSTMGRKLLLIEDHDGLRRIMGFLLSKNYEVVSAKNGLEAMGWLTRGMVPDVIVTDAKMPELNGTQFLSNLRCSGIYNDIPVVVVSAAENEEDERRFRQLGVRDFIRKPFNPMNLHSKVNQAVHAREQQGILSAPFA